jgi:hypothetical protein
VSSAYKSAEKDNNLIYHERVIPEHKLPPLEKKSMTSPLDLPDDRFTFFSGGKDPWMSLVPYHVKQGESIWAVCFFERVEFFPLFSDLGFFPIFSIFPVLSRFFRFFRFQLSPISIFPVFSVFPVSSFSVYRFFQFSDFPGCFGCLVEEFFIREYFLIFAQDKKAEFIRNISQEVEQQNNQAKA